MATQPPTVGTLPRGAPTAQQLDALPSRLAQAAGVRAGTSQAAVGAVTAALTAAEGPALVASDAIQSVVEDAMTLAAQTAMASTGACIAAIEQLLQPLQQDVAAFIKANTRKRRCAPGGATSTQTSSSVAAALPPPLPQDSPPALTVTSTSPPLNVSPAGTLNIPRLVWSLYWNCTTGQVAAVPNLTVAQRESLLADGWNPLIPPGTITASSASDVGIYLESIADSVRKMCSVPRGTIPGTLPAQPI